MVLAFLVLAPAPYLASSFSLSLPPRIHWGRQEVRPGASYSANWVCDLLRRCLVAQAVCTGSMPGLAPRQLPLPPGAQAQLASWRLAPGLVAAPSSSRVREGGVPAVIFHVRQTVGTHRGLWLFIGTCLIARTSGL